MKDKNIGLTGLESLRIDGMKIGNIPLGQGNEAREGLADFIKTERETLRNNIIAKFPKHKKDFLEAQVKECKGNIKRIKEFKQKLKSNIQEYRQLIKNCEFREKELVKYDKDIKVVGDLAESWDISEDGLIITFYLRKGVKWQDGHEFTAEDIYFTYQKLIDPNVGTPYSGDFEKVKNS